MAVTAAVQGKDVGVRRRRHELRWEVGVGGVSFIQYAVTAGGAIPLFAVIFRTINWASKQEMNE